MRQATAALILIIFLAGCASSQSAPDAPSGGGASVGAALTLEAQARQTEQAGLPVGPGNLSGVVYNMSSAPLSNVLLFVDPEHMMLSAPDGNYRFEALEHGEHMVSALSHNHIDVLEGQTAFIYAQADIKRDFHLSEGLQTNFNARLLNESDEPLRGTVGFYRLDDLKMMAQVESMGEVLHVTLPTAGYFWVATLPAGGQLMRGALLNMPPNRTREGEVRLFREPARELGPTDGKLVTISGAMTPPDSCTALAFVVQALDRDTGQSLGATFSAGNAYTINFSAEATEGRLLIRYDAVCSRTQLATDALALTVDPEVGGSLTHDVMFDGAQ